MSFHRNGMKKISSTKPKTKRGQDFYEPWMDYKDDVKIRRASSVSSLNTSTSRPRYRFANEYAESVSTTPTIMSPADKRVPLVISTPTPSKLSSKSTSQGSIVKRTAHNTPPPPYKPPASSGTDYSKDKKLMRKIEVEFKAFYSWTTNGTEDDLTTSNIEKILFPRNLSDH